MLGILMIKELKNCINLYKNVENYEDMVSITMDIILYILLVIGGFLLDILIMPLEIILYLVGKKLMK